MSDLYNSILSASVSGGSGGGGEKTLYQHFIVIRTRVVATWLNVVIINDSSSEFTKESLTDYLSTNAPGGTKFVGCSGPAKTYGSDTKSTGVALYASGNKIYCNDDAGDAKQLFAASSGDYMMTLLDTVVAL